MPKLTHPKEARSKWVTFRLDPDVARNLRMAAAEDVTTLQALCERYVADGLRKREQKKSAA